MKHRVNVITGALIQKPEGLDAICVLGGVCIKCGFSDTDCLVIDHIAGDGCMERKIMSGKKLYMCIYQAFKYNITEAIDIIRQKYQVLCANCNMKKARQNVEYAHNLLLQYSNINSRREAEYLLFLIRNDVRKRRYSHV